MLAEILVSFVERVFDFRDGDRVVVIASAIEHLDSQVTVVAILDQGSVDRVYEAGSAETVQVFFQCVVGGLVAARRDLNKPGPGDFGITRGAQTERGIHFGELPVTQISRQTVDEMHHDFRRPAGGRHLLERQISFGKSAGHG